MKRDRIISRRFGPQYDAHHPVMHMEYMCSMYNSPVRTGLLLAILTTFTRPAHAAAARPEVGGQFTLTISGIKADWVKQAESGSVFGDVITQPPMLATKGSVAAGEIGDVMDYAMEPTITSSSVLSDTEQSLRLRVKAGPKDPMAHARLARFFLRQIVGAKDHGAKYAAASQAFLELERTRALLQKDADKLQLMAPLVRTSYVIDRYDKTNEYAEEWMKKTPVASPEYGNAQHLGHTALGLIARSARDLQGAKDHLAMSADHSGSPQLTAFGPCMDLAAALMDQGQKDAVSDYLEACGKFWKAGDAKLAEWNKVLDAGNRPDFSGHFSF